MWSWNAWTKTWGCVPFYELNLKNLKTLNFGICFGDFKSSDSALIPYIYEGQIHWIIDNLIMIAFKNNYSADFMRRIQEKEWRHVLSPQMKWSQSFHFFLL